MFLDFVGTPWSLLHARALRELLGLAGDGLRDITQRALPEQTLVRVAQGA
jgi:hypothetical protein